MSLATLERNILVEARVLLEWSTGDIEAEDGEMVVRLPSLQVNVCITAEHDKRP